MLTWLMLLLGCDGDVDILGDSYALAFDGSGCVEVPMDTDARSEELTLELTLRASVDASTITHQPLLVWPGVVAMVELEDGRVAVGPPADPGAGVYSTESFLDGAVHHVAASWDATGRVQLFTDGQRVGFAEYAEERPGAPLQIGCWRDEDVSFEGLIDEVRVSSVARYSQDFEPTYERYSLDKDTTALWHFDAGQGEVAADSAGQYDGTIVGAEWVPFGANADDTTQDD